MMNITVVATIIAGTTTPVFMAKIATTTKTVATIMAVVVTIIDVTEISIVATMIVPEMNTDENTILILRLRFYRKEEMTAAGSAEPCIRL